MPNKIERRKEKHKKYLEKRLEIQRRGYKCEECFDIGCRCGGIGVSCHGCCDCEAGERARERRKRALGQVVVIANTIKSTHTEK